MTKNERIAREIIEFLKEKDMWSGVAVYFDRKRITDDEKGENGEVLEENIEVQDFLEYNNGEGITLSFEGPLYSALHGEYGWTTKDAFEELLGKHGMYFEFGHSWSANIVS